jgi:hypothetical protein
MNNRTFRKRQSTQLPKQRFDTGKEPTFDDFVADLDERLKKHLDEVQESTATMDPALRPCRDGRIR